MESSRVAGNPATPASDLVAQNFINGGKEPSAKAHKAMQGQKISSSEAHHAAVALKAAVIMYSWLFVCGDCAAAQGKHTICARTRAIVEV